MSIHPDTTPVTPAQGGHPPFAPTDDDWELDITIVESGPAADKLIRMTDDGCGTTCQSACSTTCP